MADEDVPQQRILADAYMGDEGVRIRDWVRNQYVNIKASRSSIERTWNLNLAFYFGQHYVLPRGNQGLELTVPPAAFWRVRPVINYVRRYIRKEHSKLTAQKPTSYIVPASSDDRDLFAAQAGEQIWESLYREHKLSRIISRAIWWNQICGTSFIKAYWDPEKVVNNATPPDPMTGETALVGDICYSYETPYHIFVPDFRAEDLEDQPYLIHAQLKSEDWVKMKYPGINVTPNTEKANEILEAKWLNLIGMQTVNNINNILVLEVWVKPGQVAILPEGGMFTVIGEDIASGVVGWPFAHEEYPFAKLNHIPTGRFYGASTIEDIRPLQKLYNRVRGQIVESKDTMGKPKILAERGAIVASKITSEPGQVIDYAPGYNPPQVWTPPPLPSYVVQEIDRTLADMADIAGQHEISKGQAPPGVTAATAINYLQEQDDSMLQETASSVEDSLEKIARLSLFYVSQFWDVPRLVKITGPDQAFDVKAFKSSDLRSNTDIRVESGTALPTSKAAKQAFILDLIKLGAITPDKGLEVMEMGGIQKIYESLNQDKRQAQRENLKMAAVVDDLLQQHIENTMPNVPPEVTATGDPEQISMYIPLLVPVNTWDNHAVHIETHNAYRKSQAFEDLPEAAKYSFEQHVKQHEMAMAQDLINSGQLDGAAMGGMEESMPPGPEPNPMAGEG